MTFRGWGEGRSLGQASRHEGPRRWRTLDVGTTPSYLEGDAPRVTCRRHAVVVCAVRWARHQGRFTRMFEDQTAWLAV